MNRVVYVKLLEAWYPFSTQGVYNLTPRSLNECIAFTKEKFGFPFMITNKEHQFIVNNDTEIIEAILSI